MSVQLFSAFLSTTDDAREIARCYDLGANVYITKPVDYEGFSSAIRELRPFPLGAFDPRDRLISALARAWIRPTIAALVGASTASRNSATFCA